MTETNPLPFFSQASIIDDILKELKKAKKKHPSWPEHIVARAAIVAEEAGELVRASLQFKYEFDPDPESNQIYEMRKEALHTAAMAIRFLEQLYFYTPKTINKNDTTNPTTTQSAEHFISEDSEGIRGQAR
jgi:NTP pyrophosphatase (non-canonical NTP hydrolase)